MRLNVTKILIAMGEKELSVSELAKRSGLSRQCVSYIRAGKSCDPITAAKLARGLNVPLAELAE